jgi:DNA-binding GntR family transcriptional regulator
LQLAAIRRIDGPSIAEQVVADIRETIRLGTLLPGQVISVRDIATKYNIRFNTLKVLLERLESEQLLDRYGDTFAVAAVAIDDVRAVSRLLNCVESGLIRRVCEARVLPDLDRLSGRLLDAQRLPWPEQADEIVAVLDDLCTPIASNPERRIYTDLRRAAVRHIGLGLRVMRETYPSGPTIEQLYASQFARITGVIEHCRRRNAPGAVAAARAFRTVALWIGEFSADANFSPSPHSWPA